MKDDFELMYNQLFNAIADKKLAEKFSDVVPTSTDLYDPLKVAKDKLAQVILSVRHYTENKDYKSAYFELLLAVHEMMRLENLTENLETLRSLNPTAYETLTGRKKESLGPEMAEFFKELNNIYDQQGEYKKIIEVFSLAKEYLPERDFHEAINQLHESHTRDEVNNVLIGLAHKADQLNTKLSRNNSEEAKRIRRGCTNIILAYGDYKFNVNFDNIINDFRNRDLKNLRGFIAFTILHDTVNSRNFQDTMIGKLLDFNAVNYGRTKTGLEYTDTKTGENKVAANLPYSYDSTLWEEHSIKFIRTMMSAYIRSGDETLKAKLRDFITNLTDYNNLVRQIYAKDIDLKMGGPDNVPEAVRTAHVNKTFLETQTAIVNVINHKHTAVEKEWSNIEKSLPSQANLLDKVSAAIQSLVSKSAKHTNSNPASIETRSLLDFLDKTVDDLSKKYNITPSTVHKNVFQRKAL